MKNDITGQDKIIKFVDAYILTTAIISISTAGIFALMRLVANPCIISISLFASLLATSLNYFILGSRR